MYRSVAQSLIHLCWIFIEYICLKCMARQVPAVDQRLIVRNAVILLGSFLSFIDMNDDCVCVCIHFYLNAQIKMLLDIWFIFTAFKSMLYESMDIRLDIHPIFVVTAFFCGFYLVCLTSFPYYYLRPFFLPLLRLSTRLVGLSD